MEKISSWTPENAFDQSFIAEYLKNCECHDENTTGKKCNRKMTL
jgi:hypothetical protein